MSNGTIKPLSKDERARRLAALRDPLVCHHPSHLVDVERWEATVLALESELLDLENTARCLEDELADARTEIDNIHFYANTQD